MLPPSPDDEWLQDEEWPQANDLDDPLYAIMADFYASASQALGDFDRKFSYYFPSLNRIVNREVRFNEELLEDNSLEELRYLLQTRCVDPNYNIRGLNALSVISRKKSSKQKNYLRLLLQHEVSVNAQAFDDGLATPLHFLIRDKNPGVAIFFIKEAKRLKKYINFSLPDQNGCTTLLLASKIGLEDVALCILQASVAPEVFIHFLDDEDKTAFDYAKSLNQTRLIQKLQSLDLQSKTGQFYTPGFGRTHFEGHKKCNNPFIKQSSTRTDQQSVDIKPSY